MNYTPRTSEGLVVLHTSGYWEHFADAVSFEYDGHPDVDPDETEDGFYQTLGTLNLLNSEGDIVRWLPAEVVAGIANAWVFPLRFPMTKPVSA